MYDVNGTRFDSFCAAVEAARAIRADVIEVATGLRRWHPAPPAKARARVRHVLVNADGTKTEFSKVRR
jgi:hypothetical protein